MPRRVRESIAIHVQADRYSVTELTDILRARAVTDAQLETIANEVAGVTRYGIQEVWAAAEVAGEHRHRRIEGDDVADSFERARRTMRGTNLHSLPFHHQVLNSIIWRTGEISAGDLHDWCETMADSVYYGHDLMPIGRRSRRNKLAKFREYDLDGGEGPAQNRVYYPLDESIKPPFVLVTRGVADEFSAPLEAAADRTIGVEHTQFGPRFVGDDVETLVYPEGHGMVQTTRDYWARVLKKRHSDRGEAEEPTAVVATGLGRR